MSNTVQKFFIVTVNEVDESPDDTEAPEIAELEAEFVRMNKEFVSQKGMGQFIVTDCIEFGA